MASAVPHAQMVATGRQLKAWSKPGVRQHRNPVVPRPLVSRQRTAERGSGLMCSAADNSSEEETEEERAARRERQKLGGQGQYKKKGRRKGRKERSPDDTPLRDGNKDRLMGLLTVRAAETLGYYLMETNQGLYNWWMAYMNANRIPRNKGDWDEISGDAFLRKLLTTPPDEDRGVQPRDMAVRLMDIRKELAREFREDLEGVGDENSELLRETLMASLNLAVAEGRGGDDDGPSSSSPSSPSSPTSL